VRSQKVVQLAVAVLIRTYDYKSYSRLCGETAFDTAVYSGIIFAYVMYGQDTGAIGDPFHKPIAEPICIETAIAEYVERKTIGTFIFPND